MHTHTNIHATIHAHTHKHVKHSHPNKRVYIHAYMHAHVHTYTHTRTHTHTHKYTRTIASLSRVNLTATNCCLKVKVKLQGILSRRRSYTVIQHRCGRRTMYGRNTPSMALARGVHTLRTLLLWHHLTFQPQCPKTQSCMCPQTRRRGPKKARLQRGRYSGES